MMYFITGINEFDGGIENQCIGYHETLNLCKTSIEAMQQSFYNDYEYIVIEKIGTGIHPDSTEIEWLCVEESGVERINRPAFLEGYGNFALG